MNARLELIAFVTFSLAVAACSLAPDVGEGARDVRRMVKPANDKARALKASNVAARRPMGNE